MATYPPGTKLVTVNLTVSEFIPPGTDVVMSFIPTGISGSAVWAASGNKYVLLEAPPDVSGSITPGVDLVLSQDLPVLDTAQSWTATVKYRQTGTKNNYQAAFSKAFAVDPTAAGTLYLASLAGSTVVSAVSNTLTTALADGKYALKAELTKAAAGFTKVAVNQLAAGAAPSGQVQGDTLVLNLPASSGGGSATPSTADITLNPMTV